MTTKPEPVIQESCDDCPWTGHWKGGSPSKDPGLKHAMITGHTVTGTIGVKNND